MILSIILLVIGAALVVWGADKLTDGASSIARRMGMSELVVGLTIVSFGTSLPEFIVSFFGALSGTSDICIGNIVGSNLFNTMVIIGVSAMVCPIATTKGTVHKDIPFVIMASALLAVLAFDNIFNGATDNVLSVGDGVVMLIFFVVFMAYTFAIAKDPETKSGQEEQPAEPLWQSIGWCIAGLATLIIGGDVFVDNAASLAQAMGMSEMVVGMTIVAGGTSLPELATSIVAARKGQSAMAIGNVIGSNVFNILLVLAACCCVAPIPAQSLSLTDMLMLGGSAFLFLIFARSNYRVSRGEGTILLVAYIIYISAKILML